MTETIAGTCGCGTAVEREAGSGKFGRFLNTLPMMCGACERREVEQETRRRDAVEAGRAAERERRWRSVSGIPSALTGVSLDGLDHEGREDALHRAYRWANGETPGLVLTGPFGVGKTRIAAGAANLRLATGPVLWTSAPLLFARLGSGLGSTQRDQALHLLTGRTPLVLDDLDKARPTEYAAEHVFLAVDGRVEERVPLLVTTNLSLGELATKFPDPFGEAIASRLAGYCVVSELGGDDRRLR